MSRKTTSFSQLYDYFSRGDATGYRLAWNLRHPLDREKVLAQFYQNARNLKSRQRGNVLYHEIISLKLRSDIALDRQLRALHDLSLKYVQERGPRLLGFGRLHVTKGHIHIHLMLSANELNQERRFRLSKTRYAECQLRCEQYLQQVYPDLETETIYGKERNRIRVKSGEVEFMRRTGKVTRKERLRARLIVLFQNYGEGDLEHRMKEEGFILYRRGAFWGIEHEEKRYRFKTLKLEKEWEAARTKKRSAKSPREQDLKDFYRQIEDDLDSPEYDNQYKP